MGQAGHGLAHMGNREGFSAGQQLLHRAQPFQVQIHHLLKETCRQPQDTDLVLVDDLSDLGQGRQVGGSQHQARSIEKACPDFKGRNIKSDRRQEQEDIAGSHLDIAGLISEVDDTAVGNGNAFGSAGRARCIHHIGQLLWVQSAHHCGDGQLSQPVGQGLQTHHGNLCRGQVLAQRRLGEDELHLGIAEHIGQPVARVGGVQRHIRPASLQDRQQTHDQLRRALQIDAHPDLWANPPLL